MVLVVAFVINIYSFLAKRITEAKEVLFLTTLILSFLFFSTSDPFIGIPIYIYFSLFSIVINLFDVAKTKQFHRLSTIVLFLNIVMLIQMCNLVLGILNPASLLIGKSNTDTLDIINEIFVPTLDFAVIKHFVFFDIYLFFVLLNLDLFKRPYLLVKAKKLLNFTIILLFLLIYLEFFIANFVNVNYLDSISQLLVFNNNVVRTGFFNLYVVHGWLSEPSSIIATFPFFFVLAEKGLFNIKNLFLYVFGLIAIVMTGSTTGILMALTSLIYGYLRIIKSAEKFKIIISSILILFLIGVFVILFKDQFNKVLTFLGMGENAGDYGSSTFRSQSIVLAINSFLHAPLFGVGIGTVYCHSMVFQVLANIGIIGAYLSLYFYKLLFTNYRFSILKIAIISVLFVGSGMVQTFTSPYMLVAILFCLKSNGFSLFVKNRCNLKLKWRFTHASF